MTDVEIEQLKKDLRDYDEGEETPIRPINGRQSKFFRNCSRCFSLRFAGPLRFHLGLDDDRGPHRGEVAGVAATASAPGVAVERLRFVVASAPWAGDGGCCFRGHFIPSVYRRNHVPRGRWTTWAWVAKAFSTIREHHMQSRSLYQSAEMGDRSNCVW